MEVTFEQWKGGGVIAGKKGREKEGVKTERQQRWRGLIKGREQTQFIQLKGQQCCI